MQCKINKEKMGFFITDASFDYSTKVASLAILDIKQNKKYFVQEMYSSVKEAESAGILKALEKGISEYTNIIVFCDSQFSVNEIRRMVLNSDYWKSKYSYIQIIWIPREETHIADYFSKNIDNNNEYLNKKIESFKKGCQTTNVFDLILSKKDKQEILLQFLNNSLIKYPEIKNFKFKSDFLKNAVKGIFIEFDIEDIDILKEDCVKLYKNNSELFNKGGDFNLFIEGALNLI